MHPIDEFYREEEQFSACVLRSTNNRLCLSPISTSKKERKQRVGQHQRQIEMEKVTGGIACPPWCLWYSLWWTKRILRVRRIGMASLLSFHFHFFFVVVSLRWTLSISLKREHLLVLKAYLLQVRFASKIYHWERATHQNVVVRLRLRHVLIHHFVADETG